MAAEEPRAAWEHTANPRSVKEDAGRGSKFSGCPSSSFARLGSDGTPSGAASEPDQATPLRVPDNQNLVPTHDSEWWLHSRDHIGNQKDFLFSQLNVPHIGLEVSDAGFVNESPKISKDQYFDESSHVIEDGVVEDSEKAYAECVKSDRDVRNEESNPELNSNAQKAPNKYTGESWFLDDHLMGLERNCIISKEPETLYSDFESQLVQAKKTEPWWRMTDKDELASMVAQKSLQHIENCDLPRPQTKDFRKEQLPSLESLGHYETLPSSLDWTTQTGFSDFSNHHWGKSAAISVGENQCMLRDMQHSLPNSDSLLSCKDFSTGKRDHGLTPTFPGNDPSKAQLLEALCHSQTRAREAEKAAQEAYNEKEHIITLFFRQASQLFACKQWLQLLQLENFSLQLIYNNQPVSSLFPTGTPWVPYKSMQTKKAEHKVVKQKQSSTNCGAGRSATAFWVGLSLTGAGLLLGWSMGWLLPST